MSHHTSHITILQALIALFSAILSEYAAMTCTALLLAWNAWEPWMWSPYRIKIPASQTHYYLNLAFSTSFAVCLVEWLLYLREKRATERKSKAS
jgi:hypothetical protein